MCFLALFSHTHTIFEPLGGVFVVVATIYSLQDKEETGWKLVHKDVFRPPAKNPMFFSVLVGVGTQVQLANTSVLLRCSVG